MRRRQAGFALIEVIASLVILMMISALLISGVRTGQRVWERLDRRTVAGEAVAGAQNLLRERIERAYASTRFDASTPYTEFDGDPDRLRFIAPPPPAQQPQPLRRYSLDLAANGDLVLSSWSDLAADPDRPQIFGMVVLRGVQAMEIGYFGPMTGDAARWRSRWRAQPAPPRLLRIRLKFRQGDSRFWPELLIHPAADVDVRCQLDAATGRCAGRPT